MKLVTNQNFFITNFRTDGKFVQIFIAVLIKQHQNCYKIDLSKK